MEMGEVMARKVIIDAGHGGVEPGAVFEGRKEKDDTLLLAFDVGNALERRGVEVEYTRVNDVYDTPFEKAAIANQSDADFFVSIHRNAMPVPGSASGIESLVYSDKGTAGLMARNINAELQKIGWKNLGVNERPGLVVLRQTSMPAVLIEAGFIDNPNDNQFFDRYGAATADAIADGIVKTFQEVEKQQEISGEMPGFYVVQTGIFRRKDYAEELLRDMRSRGFDGYLIIKDGLYYVRSGAFRELNYAIEREKQLRQQGFDTLIVRT